MSKKALEAAAFSSVSASACITPAATAERWWTKKERVEVRAVPSVAPLKPYVNSKSRIGKEHAQTHLLN